MRLILKGFSAESHCKCDTIVNISHENGGTAENVGFSVKPWCPEHGHMIKIFFPNPTALCECVAHAEFQKPTRYELDACPLHGENDGERIVVDVFPVKVTVMK